MTSVSIEAPARRKQLAEQLDRFDAILDGLAEGLTAVVTDACREGTQRAVRDAILGALRDPVVRALVAPEAPAPAPNRPARRRRIPNPLAGLRAWGRRATSAAAARTARFVRANRAAVAVLESGTGRPLGLGRAVPSAGAIGLVIGLGCRFAPPELVAALAGAGTTALVLGAGVWYRLVRAARNTTGPSDPANGA
ncbi:hypothetical protein J8F10_16500 [Gemmata sp. G18]|uniref:Uncharacterized protein n=1 Tax=Gemmata palustris TaxID=2822762 RepID=A0ABS5BT48_9BACT|nr:hypothetical protein [Gemmata palustris]MBP3956873.1 hypothetical protein [Gemmata palustris]